eukprot:244570_1
MATLKKKHRETFHAYIYKVLKQVYPTLSITMLAMKVMNSLIEDMFNRIASEASHLLKISKTNTLDTRCIETATRLVLIGNLRTHGQIEARKSVNKYNAAINNTDDIQLKKQRRSKKAGLSFPVGKIARHLKEGQYANRIGGLASIYFTSILEYITVEIIEVSGNICKDNKKQRILPKHICIAIKKDDELKKLFNEITIPQCGSALLENDNDKFK